MKNFKNEILNLKTGFFNLHPSKEMEWPICYQSAEPISNHFMMIPLPAIFSKIGIGENNQLLVPQHCVKKGSNAWNEVDWWRAAYEMLTMQFEYIYENKYGTIHSYSYKLKDIHPSLYNRAWVNRIFLFLRRWTAFFLNQNEEEIFLPIPKPIIYLTHDVDYIKKTWVLKIKYTLFQLFKIFKNPKYRQYYHLKTTIKKLVGFHRSQIDYLNYDEIFQLENKIQAKSYWNFYARRKKIRLSFFEWLIDPGYHLSDNALNPYFQFLKDKGHQIGLHQGFNSWKYTNNMRMEKTNLEDVLNQTIMFCRQHWLRFSLSDTWSAQEKLGLKLDMTLGFNDRFGFRNSSALKIPAWLSKEQKWSTTLHTVPMVLMDSHLFDYANIDSDDRKKIIDDLLDEVKDVAGCISIIWHPHVFSDEYGWKEEYIYLLDGIQKRGILTNE